MKVGLALRDQRICIFVTLLIFLKLLLLAGHVAFPTHVAFFALIIPATLAYDQMESMMIICM
jgi:hypothetical protein